jgi:hypothetical protein
MGLKMSKESICLNLPEWLRSYFETGWSRYQQGLNFQPSTEGQSFSTFEEYVVWLIGELVKEDYNRFKELQRKDLNKISEAIKISLEKCIEKENLRKSHFD